MVSMPTVLPQPVIDDEHVRQSRTGGDARLGLFGRGRREHLAAPAFKQVAHRLEDGDVVIEHQYPLPMQVCADRSG